MAMDVMAASGCKPIIVGDVEDVRRLWGVLPPVGERRAQLLMEGKGGALGVSPLPDSRGFDSGPLVVVVALAGDEAIAFAYLAKVGNPLRAISHLDDAALKAVAESIIADRLFTIEYAIFDGEEPPERPLH